MQYISFKQENNINTKVINTFFGCRWGKKSVHDESIKYEFWLKEVFNLKKQHVKYFDV